jgi:hypothetical protein
MLGYNSKDNIPSDTPNIACFSRKKRNRVAWFKASVLN